MNLTNFINISVGVGGILFLFLLILSKIQNQTIIELLTEIKDLIIENNGRKT